ncbi:hypothetical protein FQN54_008773 [Arachnomyces sp. PD_36]|nr:hypothetical protein FQN54_008773 [Arachnomyces sp. PD_36]
MAQKKSQESEKTDWSAWKTELWALSWSVFSFIVMVVLLAIFDGRPIFDWKSVTLNAIIAVVSVSMKASLTFAVAELIGQWKWILFSRESRPLIDFERIDLATRGPLGSLSILWRMNGLWRLQLGGLIIVLAIALEPFTQQLLQLEEGIEFIETSLADQPHAARTPRVEMYSLGFAIANRTTSTQKNDTTAYKSMTRLDLEMQTAILSDLSRSQEQVNQQAPVQCPTEICAWDQLETLGVCSQCKDLTSDLKRVNDFGNVFDAIYRKQGGDRISSKKDGTGVVLPNGHFLVNINGCDLTKYACEPIYADGDPLEVVIMTSFGTGDQRKTNAMKEVNTLIWSMSIIYADLDIDTMRPVEWPDAPIRATECAIYYCVKTIDTRVEGNIIQENVTEATDAVRAEYSFGLSSSDWVPPENRPPDDKNSTLEFNEMYADTPRDNLILHFPDNSSKPEYALKPYSVWSISHFFQNLLSMNLTGSDSVTKELSKLLPSDSVRYNGELIGSWNRLEAAENIWHPSKRDIPKTFETLATSMTNVLRELGSGTGGREDVYGRAGTPTKYYKTQWGWIVLHGMVLVGGVYFWWATVQNTSGPPNKVPPWRNSSLAAISKGSAVDVLKGADGSVEEMEKWAREHDVMMPVDETSKPYARNESEEDGLYLMREVMGMKVSPGRASEGRVRGGL